MPPSNRTLAKKKNRQIEQRRALLDAILKGAELGLSISQIAAYAGISDATLRKKLQSPTLKRLVTNRQFAVKINAKTVLANKMSMLKDASLIETADAKFALDYLAKTDGDFSDKQQIKQDVNLSINDILTQIAGEND